MKGIGFAVLVCLCVPLVLAQRGVQPVRPPEKYPDAMRRLEALSVIPLTPWRVHGDMPHGEDPGLDDSSWRAVTLTGGRGQGQGQAQGAAWYRTVFEVPASLRGARLKLAPRLANDGRVFVNGGLVAQGEGRTLDPIAITENAQPGARFAIAVKVPFHAATGRLQGAQILVDYPGRQDPATLRNEILSAEALLDGNPAGAAEHQKQLDGVVAAIDFAALDRGDQAGFARSLDAATRALEPIHDWERQFTIRLVGNAHIDMAWLWPWTETVEVVRDTFTTALQ